MNETQELGVLMLDVAGLELTAGDREVLSHPRTGGVILGLHGRNYASLEQLQQLVAAIRECQDGLLIAVDQEGGRVQRFRKDFTRLPPMHVFGELWAQDADAGLAMALECGWLMASEVLACGLDLSFAPVLDLYMADSRIIADRAFAADPDTVVALASAFIDGMHEAGMKATGKHFPGHGSVPEDSHVELPVDPRALAQLQATDLVPFQRCLNRLDALMPGHVLYPQVDSRCAALSPVWLQQVLRGQMGFNGVIFSDDLTMAAAGAAGELVQRAELALSAGCDMILVCNDRGGTLQVLDWLDRQAIPPSARLPAMRGACHWDWQTLRATRRWQQARERIAQLVGEGQRS